MEPLFYKNSKGGGYKSDGKAQKPESIDENGISGSVEGWRSEVRHGWIDEIPVDSKTRDLGRKVHEDLVREILWLLLQVLVRFDNKCCDHSRE